jgi:beta-lactamase regulating signal transducer with metallopeptidase domain
MSEVLSALMRVNLALAAATGLVLVLRLPARRLFGARIAYGLWGLVPLAAMAMLAPARVVTMSETPSATSWAPLAPTGAPPPGAIPQGLDPALLLGGLWIVGALASLAWLAWRQVQFGRALAERRAGPAVIGVLRPRVVTPADFTDRYTPREQLVVLAHERTHIARQDSRINAAVALARCVNWFNPAAHLLAHYLRIDQEFACDAQVVAAHPRARRSYAEAMLKAQLAARPLPMGCYWPASSAHPLAQRVRLLSRPVPGRGRRLLGTLAMALLAIGGAWSAWASRPAEVRFVPPPAQAPRAGWVAAARNPAPSAPVLSGRRRAAAESPPAVVEAATPQVPSPQLVLADFAPQAGPTPDPMPTPEVRAEERAGWTPRIRKIHSVARQSAVEPGSAVRVLATMIDRDGVSLVTDMTAYGSQSRYRTGYFRRDGSRYALFTRVRQEGDRLWVTASLDDRFRPETSGVVALSSGQTGRIALAGGHVVTVTPTVRPETPEEVEEGRRDRRDSDADRDLWRAFRAIPF